MASLRASSPIWVIWASEASLARTRERAAKPRGAEPSLARSGEARLARLNRRACSQASSQANHLLFLLSPPCQVEGESDPAKLITDLSSFGN